MAGKNKTGADAFVRENAIEVCFQLRLQGKSYRKIEALTGIDHATAHVYIKERLQQRRKENDDLAEELREMELERLDRMRQEMETYLVNYPEKAPDAVRQLLNISERAAKLQGIDKPVKVAPTSPDGESPYEGDTSYRELLSVLLARKCHEIPDKTDT